MTEPLRICVPLGALLEGSVRCLREADIDVTCLDDVEIGRAHV